MDYDAKRFATFTQHKDSKVCIINDPNWQHTEKQEPILYYADYIEYIDNEQLYFFSDSLHSICNNIDENEDFYILIETRLLQNERFSKLSQFDSKVVFFLQYLSL